MASVTTKLEAVNTMLSAIGEAPINNLNSGLVDAELAETILDSISREVQSQGWNFNRDLNKSYAANTAGEIVLGNAIVRADLSMTSDQYDMDLVQRGTKMYDRKNHTFNIGKSVKLDVVSVLDFADMPEVAKRYVTIRSTRIFQDRVVGDQTLHAYQERDEMQAKVDLLEFEGETQDHSIFDNYGVYRILDRVGGKRVI